MSGDGGGVDEAGSSTACSGGAASSETAAADFKPGMSIVFTGESCRGGIASGAAKATAGRALAGPSPPLSGTGK